MIVAIMKWPDFQLTQADVWEFWLQYPEIAMNAVHSNAGTDAQGKQEQPGPLPCRTFQPRQPTGTTSPAVAIRLPCSPASGVRVA